MIDITFPDGSIKQFPVFSTGFDVASRISEGLARNAIAIEVGGQLQDIHCPIETSGAVRIITPKDTEALNILRHSAAHVMAEAVLRLYPGAQLTIGPTVENGFYYDIDMPPISEEAFEAIEKEMKKIIDAKQPFVRKNVSKSDALQFYQNELYKTEMIQDLDDGTISLYTNGNFTDLCRGPHIPHSGFIKAFKLLRISGAYWRADQNNTQLQRLYGTAFFDKKDLTDYLHFLEEAKRRNHRRLGTQLDLFSFHDEAPGMAFFHAKGMAIWNSLLDYWREEHIKAGYVEIKTPIMLNRSLWEQSGHWENYRENMYTTQVDEVDYAIKPMNCPGGILLYKTKLHSYRDLPLRSAEIGLVHRHEMSGVLNGLFRVRMFHQDDAHIFMTYEQITNEILGILNLVDRVYSTFGLSFHLELSTRPEKSIGTDEQWENAVSGLQKALEVYGREYSINEGDGAFYGPKIDIHIKDALNRTWQCGTIQLDMEMPNRFQLEYIEKDNHPKRPIMIHRVVFGSIERFLGILIEHFGGKFPLWLAPTQAIILPMNDSLINAAETLQAEFMNHGIRTELDRRTESLNKKIREAQLQYVPLMIILGQKEFQENKISIRTLDGTVKNGLSKDEFFSHVRKCIDTRRLESLSF